MTTIVGVMDRDTSDQNTDVNVVVDPATRTLTWVPRDVYSPSLGDRVNSVFRLGGDQQRYISVICELGFNISESLLIWPRIISETVSDLVIDVPVSKRMQYWYPKSPWVPLQDGKKRIKFSPPNAKLYGERIHQWLGARTSVNGKFEGDLWRCTRQQTLVRRLLEVGFDFNKFFAAKSAKNGISMSSRRAVEDLATVTADWTFTTMDDIEHQTINGMWVFVKKST